MKPKRYSGPQVDKALRLAFASTGHATGERAFLLDCEDFFFQHQHLPAAHFEAMLRMCDPSDVARLQKSTDEEREGNEIRRIIRTVWE